MKRMSFLFAALTLSGSVLAADTPATPDAWAAKMMDPTQNGSAFKDPAVFQQWLNAMMNPATQMAMMQQGMDPNTALRMLSGMMNPAVMPNYMQFTDPAVAMKWLAASMDPRFITALLSQGINPSTYLNMMQAPLSPQMLNLGAQMLNPALYGKWLTAPMSPAALNTMTAPMNPNTYMGWMGTGMNPGTYGPWGQMLNQPNGQAGALPVDPAVLMRMLQMPQFPVAPQYAR